MLKIDTSRIGTTYVLSVVMRPYGPCGLELVRQVLVSSGIKDDEIVELDKHNKKILEVYSSTPKVATALKVRVDELKMKDVSSSVRELKKEQWLTKWKEDFKPFAITKKYCIVPAWMKDDFKSKNKEPVYIDTNLAFGTGMHPTTKFIAKFIERCSGRFDSFFDIGTGTGILSVLASKYGALKISAIDISSDCIKCSKENFMLNGLEIPALTSLDLAEYRSRKKYDFVAANLTTKDLMNFSKKIAAAVKPNKYLAISGISLDNLNTVKDRFKKLNMLCLKKENGKDWAAVLFKKGGIL